MVKPRTHFEQIPLEVIKKIAGEQIAPEIIIERDQASSNLKRKKSSLRAKGRSKSSSLAHLQREGRKL